MSTWVGVFAVIGVTTLLLTKAATPGIAVTVDSTLPNPTNIRAYGDDRVATITWDPVSNPGNKNIIGYYVSWGSGGAYTSARQTEYNMQQIQPLTNGTLYNVKVQSVQGSTVNVSTPGAHDDETATEYKANGKVSTGITTTVTPSSARVDQLRQQMTGFFDDFNIAAGAFDELKWNTAGSSCTPPNSLGAFINNQFHAHSQSRSSFGNYTYCDRGQVVNRPRAIFDTTGKTEANPGVITFDFDGVTNGRDAWYIDLIPTTARKSGVPLDITSHASIFDDDTADPVLLRIVQQPGSVRLSTYDNNKNPADVTETYVNCPDFKGEQSFDATWCGALAGTQATDAAGQAQPVINTDHPGAVPNVRRQWKIEISPTKVKVFVSGYRILEANMPSQLANNRQWVIHNNIFTYNTGKDTPANPTTSMLHWDNFGFNGPAPTTVTHNYLEGGTNGTQPYIGRGVTSAEAPEGNRSTKINIQDPIGSPLKARLMFTFGAFGYQTYNWSSNDNVVINGKKYNYPDPRTNSVQPPSVGDGIAAAFNPFADSIAINPADLKQGMNDVQLNLVNTSGAAVMNVHIELEYTNGTQPSYTQPKDIFGVDKILAQIQPTMASHDNYLFVEQDFGLPSGTLDSTTPIPPTTGSDTTKPTVSLTSPANETTVSAGASFTAEAAASDNTGVTKVEFYVGSVLKATDTSSPYSQSLSTSGLDPGSYNVTAIAYDAANNNTTSNNRTIIIPAPADTTKPTVSIANPSANATIKGSNVNVTANAADASGISKVEFFIDGQALGSADTSEPYSVTLDTTKYSNGSHSLTAKATDTKNNSQTSNSISVTIDNTVADTTLPTVSISAPVSGASISGSMAFIQVSASDNAGISKVEFFMDGTSLGAADTQAPYQFTLNTTLYPNGSHSLTAKATDTSNNSRTSTAVSITINNADIIAPSIIINSPASGATISGIYNVTVTAADTVGVTKVEFLVDGSLKGTDSVPNPYAYALDTKTLSNGNHTIRVNAYDAANNIGTASVTVSVNNAVAAEDFKYDFSGDGKVGIQDLLTVLNNYGKTVAPRTNGDVTGDGKVGIQDLTAIIGKYGTDI